MKLINLTNQRITLFKQDPERVDEAEGITFEPNKPPDSVPRIIREYNPDGKVCGLPRYRVDISIINLPEPQEGVIYIVGKSIVEYAWGRTDLVHPGRLIRDGDKVVGAVGVIW